MGFFNRLKSNFQASKVIKEAEVLYRGKENFSYELMGKLQSGIGVAQQLIAIWAVMTASRMNNINDEGFSAILLSIDSYKDILCDKIYYDEDNQIVYRYQQIPWTFTNHIIATAYAFYLQTSLEPDIERQMAVVNKFMNEATDIVSNQFSL